MLAKRIAHLYDNRMPLKYIYTPIVWLGMYIEYRYKFTKHVCFLHVL